jgi:hypothetical protein
MVLSLTELAHALGCPIRSALQGNVEYFAHKLVQYTWVVVIGVAVEGIEFAVLFAAWAVRQIKEKRERNDLKKVNEIFPASEESTIEHNEPHHTWVKFVAFAGLIGVIIGVSGELHFEDRLQVANNALQTFDEARLTAAQIEAGDASESAKTAHEEADAVKKETDTLKIRLGNASRKLGDIQQDTLAQGPRWRLLKNGETVFVDALKPFPGQRAMIVVCGQDDGERLQLEQMLLNLLPIAGWEKPRYVRWAGCPLTLTGGNDIFFVSSTPNASGRWVESYSCRVESDRIGIEGAAKALCDALNKLNISTMAWKEYPNQDGAAKAREFWGNGSPGGPGEIAFGDPSTIFIEIGANQPIFADEQKRRQKFFKEQEKK